MNSKNISKKNYQVIIKENISKVVMWFEIGLAITVLIFVAYTFGVNVFDLFLTGFEGTHALAEALHFVLFLAIGVEISRLLISYNIESVIEVLVFVIAHRLLLSEDSALSIILIVAAIVILFAARHFFSKEKS